MPSSTAEDVLAFWFSDETKAHWFSSTPAFDLRVKEALGDAYKGAVQGNLAAWESTRDGRLALVILLDQVPRMIFRDKPESYASDAQALSLAKHCLAHGDDIALPPGDERRSFYYLPFMHSENLDDQRRSVELHETYGPEAGLVWARGHRETVARFGRFPHRNARLGRESTPAELAFMQAKEAGG
ncbi:MAG: DUF924 domain-containing protein [Devosiaceae bacterium]|nr:DUF924 domain-containing protein [Devosiaceae bacterium MH13]